MGTILMSSALHAATPQGPGGINADGLIGLFLWIIGILACISAVKIVARADSSSPRRNADTGLNLAIAMTIIVIFLGGATIWTAFEGIRDLVLRGGQSTSQGGQ
ncbi:MAG: hypothetical protein ACKVZ6_00895 [Kineosporiaceae bacterium]|jgi:hypothetical protein